MKLFHEPKASSVPPGESYSILLDISSTSSFLHTHTHDSKVSKSLCQLPEDCSQGLFHCLPTELFHLILSLLLPDDLATFSLTSSQINSSIRDYIFTVAGSQHVLPTAHPLVTGSGHVLSAMNFKDENEYCQESSDQANIRETIKQFESLGMSDCIITVDP